MLCCREDGSSCRFEASLTRLSLRSASCERDAAGRLLERADEGCADPTGFSPVASYEQEQLVTTSSGRVLLRLNVVSRYFQQNGISTGGVFSVQANSAVAAAQDTKLRRQVEECTKLFRQYLAAKQQEAGAAEQHPSPL